MNLMDLMIRIGVEDEATGKIGSVADNAKNAVSRISTAITTAAGVVTAAGAAVGTYATTVGSAFEAQMSKVEAISGATAAQVEALTKKAKQLGIDTKYSATEAAQAFEYMAMAGWKTEQMLGGVSGIIDLAAASGVSLARTSDIVTDALTAFGLAAEDSTHFADVLAAVSANANTNVDMLGESFKYVAPLAGAMGYSIEDVATALGLMANSGIKASQAGTALRSALSHLAKPSDTAIESLRRLGLVTEDDVVLALKTADGQARSLSETMTLLRDAFSNLSEVDALDEAARIFGQEAMSGMLAIINTTDEEFARLTASIEDADGSAKAMADTMIDNLAGSFTLLKSSAEGFGLAVYEHIKEPLNNIVQWSITALNKVTAAFSEGGILGVFRMFSEETKKMIPTAATSFVGFISDTVERIGALTGMNVAPAVDNLKAIGAAVQTVQEAFENGGRSSGMLEILQQFQNLTGVDISGIVEGVQGFFGAVKNAAPEAIENVGRAVDSILAPFHTPDAQAIIDKISGSIHAFVGWIEEADFTWIASVGEGIGKLIEPIVTAAPEVIENVKKGVRDFFGVIFGADGVSLKGIADSVVTLFSPITSSVASAAEVISRHFAEIMEYARESGFGDNLRAIAGAAVELFGAFTTNLGRLIEESAESTGYFVSQITEDDIDRWNTFAGVLKNIVDFFRDMVDFGFGSVADLIAAANAQNQLQELYASGAISGEKYEAYSQKIAAGLFESVGIRSSAFVTGKSKEEIAAENAPTIDLTVPGVNLLPTLPNTDKAAKEVGRQLAETVANEIVTGAAEYSTGHVGFAESASGKAAVGLGNTILAASEVGDSTLSVNVYLDGEQVARNQYGYLKDISKQKGEPVNA